MHKFFSITVLLILITIAMILPATAQSKQQMIESCKARSAGPYVQHFEIEYDRCPFFWRYHGTELSNKNLAHITVTDKVGNRERPMRIDIFFGYRARIEVRRHCRWNAIGRPYKTPKLRLILPLKQGAEASLKDCNKSTSPINRYEAIDAILTKVNNRGNEPPNVEYVLDRLRRELGVYTRLQDN